jgi:hypothetical protein
VAEDAPPGLRNVAKGEGLLATFICNRALNKMLRGNFARWRSVTLKFHIAVIRRVKFVVAASDQWQRNQAKKADEYGLPATGPRNPEFL